MSILKLENICYQYDGNKKQVLKDINFEFEKGKIYAIVGQSGAGKTTLLSILSSLAKPTSGKIYLNGEDINKIDKYKFRSNHVGVVFQSFNLLTHLTALENVVLSMNISGKKFDNKKETAIEMLKKVGLNEEEANRRVLKLSGGQQQRVAIARALSYDPQIILADEPTGNLDSKSCKAVINAFLQAKRELDATIFMVTHDSFAASFCDRVLILKDGQIFKELVKKDTRLGLMDELLETIRSLGGISDDDE